MKKLFTLFSMALLSAFAFTFSSCNDDDGPNYYSYYTYDGTQYDIVNAYYAEDDEWNEDYLTYRLVLTPESISEAYLNDWDDLDNCIYIRITENRLGKTVKFDGETDPIDEDYYVRFQMYVDGEYYRGDSDVDYWDVNPVGSTLKVTKSGDTFTVQINFSGVDGKPLKCSFKGTFTEKQWELR